MKHIIGIDCSSKTIDAVILGEDKSWIDVLSVESKSKDMDIRFLELYYDFITLLRTKFDLDKLNYYAIVENPIFLQNVKTTVAITKVVAAAEIALSNCGIEFIGVDPKAWKKSVLADGNANKEKIMNFAKAIWGSEITSQDLADAACLALWGVMRFGYENPELLRERQKG